MSENRITIKNQLAQTRESETMLFNKVIEAVRDDMKDNPYILEALRVLPVQGYRSCIGAIWNSVVDDLRNKIMYRSLEMFNKEVSLRREVKTYEDFQEYVNDDELIEGAYKIGVIGWEARKVLRHAKETRHIFSGHPHSSEPSQIKVLGVMEDCIKYVLSQEYPVKIIDIDEYISIMGTAGFDRNGYAVSNALSDLPDRYKIILINKIYDSYIRIDCSSELRSNIEFVAPLLWIVISKDTKISIVRKLDHLISTGNTNAIEYGFYFVEIVDGQKYLSMSARNYKIKPLIDDLLASLDSWKDENRIVRELSNYSAFITPELLKDYIWGLTQTYVGHIGGSAYFSRTNFYADGAALIIPQMFEKFDDNSADIFLIVIKENEVLRSRIRNHSKFTRLQTLGEIIYEKLSTNYAHKNVFEALLDEEKEKEFFKLVSSI